MDYKNYVTELIEAAEYIAKNNPEFPDVAATYKKTATIIETLLAEREKAVEVVRCKDCKNYILTGKPPFMYYACNRHGAIRAVDEDDFCSYGTPPDRHSPRVEGN